MTDTRHTIMSLIREAVANDELDYDGLREINNCVRGLAKDAERRKSASVAAVLRPGMTVMIRHDANLSPKYVLGTRAEVQKVNSATATIKLGHVNTPRGKSRFYTGQVINCPLNALDPVMNQEEPV